METTKPFFFTRFFRWLFSWRIMRRLLLTFVTLITLWALFHAEENWRGRRAWRQYKADLTAKGEQLDLQSYIPKPVPDDQNFAAIPFFQKMFPKPPINSPEWSSNYSVASELVVTTNRAKGERHLVDLDAWAKAFAAVQEKGKAARENFQSANLDAASRAKAVPAVLAGLRECEGVFEQLRVASSRPHSRLMVHYNLDDPAGILLPHLSNIKGIIHRLQLKAAAELVSGDSASALEDVKLAFRLTDSVKDEPFLISLLVRFACLQLAVHPVWEGAAEHRWTDAQLEEIQTGLQKFDFLADLERSLDSERAFGILTTDLLARQKYRLSALVDPSQLDAKGAHLENFIGAMIVPRGWFNFEQINLCKMYDVQLKGIFDTAQRRIFLDQVNQNAREFEDMVSKSKGIKAFLQHRMMATMLLPALSKTSVRCAFAVVVADQAFIACALERYRLAHGQFPEGLEKLSPQFAAKVPHDVLTGEPYRYRRTEDGRFVLYSIGWNGKDDGGVPGKTLNDEKNGDWIWRYPAKQ